MKKLQNTIPIKANSDPDLVVKLFAEEGKLPYSDSLQKKYKIGKYANQSQKKDN